MSVTLKADDKVLIARKVARADTGYWNPRMDAAIGQIGTVQYDHIDRHGRYAVRTPDGDSWWFHRDCLELQQSQEPAFGLLAAMTGKPLKFRSGCAVKFVAYSPDAKPHCQLVLLNPSTGNIVTRYANGKSSEEPYNEPGDILNVEAA